MTFPVAKRRPLFHRSEGAPLPERSAHLPMYDSCPHRGPLLDHSTCSCLTFGCKLHGTCSTQPRTGLTLCQECDDFPGHGYPGHDHEQGLLLGGGSTVAIGNLVTAAMTRRIHPDLRIELWLRPEEPLPLQESFVELGVQICRLPAITMSIGGWNAKSSALLNTRCRRAIWLDSDCYPHRSFEDLLQLDAWGCQYHSSWIYWEHYGLTPDGRLALDGGAWGLDREKLWPVVKTFHALDQDHHRTYQWGCGDEAQLRAALRKHQVNYVGFPILDIPGAGRVYDRFVHTVANKLRLHGQEQPGAIKSAYAWPQVIRNWPLHEEVIELWKRYLRLAQTVNN